MTERAAFLGAVRGALGRPHARDGGLDPVAPGRASRVFPDPTPLAARVQTFEASLAAVKGEVVHVADASAVPQALAELAVRHGVRSVATSGEPELEAWAASVPGVERVDGGDRRRLFEVDAGLTATKLAVAQTGTLVLGSSYQTRLVSLLPALHVAILRAEAIVATLPEAYAAIDAERLALGPETAGSVVTFVTGPSRTADIELRLVVGVHGPKSLVVVLIGA